MKKDFYSYLRQTGEILEQANDRNDPALWLFNKNGRTLFFMLEGLSRVYEGLYNSKKFKKLKKQFKIVEDGLGQIDYYNWLSESVKYRQIPSEYKEYIGKRKDQESSKLGSLLNEKGWTDGTRIRKIKGKLKNSRWTESAKEVRAIEEFYKESIKKINKFVTKTGYRFENVEEDVHELRRRLRWLSIYPQAFGGTIRYAPEMPEPPEFLKKYLTESIVNSPYNKLPESGEKTAFLLIDKNYFLALSWIIDRLGSLKDEGLLLTGLSEAISTVSGKSSHQSMNMALTILGKKQRPLRVILDEAENVTRTFFEEKIPEHLLFGTMTLSSSL
jgi:hypothetical protein